MSNQFSGDAQESAYRRTEGAPELNRIYVGDCIEVMKAWPENFVDTIITDPPYGIGFMGKEWDRFDPEMIKRRTKTYYEATVKDGLNPKITHRIGSPAEYAGLYNQSAKGHQDFQEWCCAWATEAFRIAKPGAFMLVSGGTRTYHRMAVGLEDAGWQIRDCLMWLYGSGFPKSLDISKSLDKRANAEREVIGYKRQGPRSMFDGGKPRLATLPATLPATLWNGWGTALKPAWEPIIVAMKPTDGTFAENAEKWGVAGVNIDGSRIQTFAESFQDRRADKIQQNAYGKFGPIDFDGSKGRWPANLLLDEEAAAMLDQQSAGMRASRPRGGTTVHNTFKNAKFNMGKEQIVDGSRFNDSGGASRFFYVAKADRAERNEGCDELPRLTRQQDGEPENWDLSDGKLRARLTTEPQGNHHPTVTPLSLMKYLCNLTRTPTGGIVLDPFAGSGTTLWAAEFHNRPWIGIEMNREYVAIAEARLTRERSQMKMAI